MAIPVHHHLNHYGVYGGGYRRKMGGLRVQSGGDGGSGGWGFRVVVERGCWRGGV